MTPGELILLIPVAMAGLFAGTALLFMGIVSICEFFDRK